MMIEEILAATERQKGILRDQLDGLKPMAPPAAPSASKPVKPSPFTRRSMNTDWKPVS